MTVARRGLKIKASVRVRIRVSNDNKTDFCRRSKAALKAVFATFCIQPPRLTQPPILRGPFGETGLCDGAEYCM